MSEELKTCPFCGRKPELRHDENGFSFIVCANDNCYARTDGCLNEQAAVAAWNRRAQPDNVLRTDITDLGDIEINDGFNDAQPDNPPQWKRDAYNEMFAEGHPHVTPMKSEKAGNKK